MNRVKLWLFTLVAVSAAFLALRVSAVSRRADAVAALDARLAGAASLVTASLRAAARESGAVVAAMGRDPALAVALRAPEPAPPPPPPARGKRGAKAPKAPPAPPPDRAAEESRVKEAARTALAAAERSLGLDLPAGTVASAAGKDALARKAEGAEPDVLAVLRTAAAGQRRGAWVRQDGRLWWATAAGAGDGGAVVLLVPVDDAWAGRLATASGVDVTFTAPEVKGVTTARTPDLATLFEATRVTGGADVGRPAPVDLSLGPVKVPKLPQPIAGGASHRARAVPLEGVKGGFAILSAAAGASVEAGAFLYRGAAGLLLLLLGSFVLGFFIRSREPVPQLPDELLAAAGRIEKGDFAARAPTLAGKLGTVAAALNRAAEIAGPAQALRGAPPAPATTDEWFQAGVAGGGRATMSTVPVATATAAALAAAPAPAPEQDEETHWQQVFQDFLRTRGACGESTEGLTYEKFRVKLEGNKAQLVAKYACNDVRFQVYVKEGKAALKATPVK